MTSRGVAILVILLLIALPVQLPPSGISGVSNLRENPEPPSSGAEASVAPTESRTNSLKGVRIFVDPGHGGSDPGAVFNGTIDGQQVYLEEADVVLSIALKLAELLTDYGADVILSRTGDYYVNLTYRAVWANGNDSDVFISIHCNSYNDPSAHGFEVYYHGLNDKGKSLAEAIHDGVLTELDFSGYSVYDRGVKPDTLIYPTSGFLVLRETSMPAALIETLFISNDSDVKLLMDEDFQWSVARGIVRGLLDFLPVGERVSGASDSEKDMPFGLALSDGSVMRLWVEGSDVFFTLTGPEGNLLDSGYVTDPSDAYSNWHPTALELENGSVLVLYNSGRDTYHKIYGRLYTPGGGFGSEFVFLESSTGHVSWPFSLKAGGRYLVFFHSDMSGSWGVYVTYSDDGRSWSAPVLITDDPTVRDRSPKAYYDGQRLYVVYHAWRTDAYHICLKYSDDLGQTWSDEIIVTREAVGHFNPAVWKFGDYLVVVYGRAKSINSYYYDLYFSYSTDGGQTWSDEIPLFDDLSAEDFPTFLPLSSGAELLFTARTVFDSAVTNANFTDGEIFAYIFAPASLPDGKIVAEWHYQSENWFALLHSSVIDLSMPVTYSVSYSLGYALKGWNNRTYSELFGGLVLPLVQDLSSGQIRGYVNDAAQRSAVAQVIQRAVLTEGLPGIALDIEAISATSAEASNFTEFFREVYKRLRPLGFLVVNVLPPRESDSWGWAAYNYSELHKYADLVLIMAYDYHGSWSDPGPISPTGRVMKVIDYALLKGIPEEKLGVAFPLYAYDWYWNGSSWLYYGAYFYGTVVAKQEAYNGNIRFELNFTEDSVTYDSMEPVLEYYDGHRHVVYFQNSESVLYRLGLLDSYGLRAASFWRFNPSIDPDVPEVLRKWKMSEIGPDVIPSATARSGTYVELFERETLSLQFVLPYPSIVEISADELSLLSLLARNGTEVVVDLAQLPWGSPINLTASLNSQLWNVSMSFSVVKLTFDLEAPEVVSGTVTLNISTPGGFARFEVYVKIGGEWDLIHNGSETSFLWNASGLANGTYLLRVVAFTQLSAYQKEYEVEVVNYGKKPLEEAPEEGVPKAPERGGEGSSLLLVIGATSTAGLAGVIVALYIRSRGGGKEEELEEIEKLLESAEVSVGSEEGVYVSYE